MIRILHTADWHLGQNFFGYDRLEEHAHFLDWLSEEIKSNDIDVLVIAGDVFDVSNPSAASQRMFYKFIYKVHSNNPHLQLVIVAGNHDSGTRLEAPQALLDELNTRIIGLVPKKDGSPDFDSLILPLKNRSGETEALCLAVPFLRQGDYPAVQAAENPYAEGVRYFYRQLIGRALSIKKGNQSLLAVGHLQATGSEIAEKDHSERTIIGGLECINPEVFSDEIAYTALGHIHKAQRVSGKDNIRYAGSPIPMSFAEKNYRHGVVLITLSNGKLKQIEKKEYEPMLSLMSLPAQSTAKPEELVELLKDLPSGAESVPPVYLEIKVLLKEPEPMLPQRIQEILSDKQVRLCRINRVYERSDVESGSSSFVTGGLQELNPFQVADSYFKQTYGNDMPDDLARLFREVYQTAAGETE